MMISWSRVGLDKPIWRSTPKQAKVRWPAISEARPSSTRGPTRCEIV